MYRGSHAAPRKSRHSRKPFVLLISIVLLVAIAVGGTFAYLKEETGEVKNTFIPGRSDTEIEEEVANNIKDSVIVKNTGTVPLLVRVAIVAMPVDEKGNVDLNSDRTLEPQISENWTKLGDYYYYNRIVKAVDNGNVSATDNLLSVPLTYTGFQVDIMAQTIQAAGDFEQSAWGHTFTPGVGWSES